VGGRARVGGACQPQRETLRTTWYLAPAEIQRDLDAFLEQYNLHRSHQGYRLAGRTPAQALREALAIDKLPSLTGGIIVAEGEEVPAAALEGSEGRVSESYRP
jgi:hypothetical protein